jgi:hypothetical protein
VKPYEQQKGLEIKDGMPNEKEAPIGCDDRCNSYHALQRLPTQYQSKEDSSDLKPKEIETLIGLPYTIFFHPSFF